VAETVGQKKIAILIPFWVQETLKRNGLQLSACLDLEKIRPLMALDDLARFLALQNTKYFKLVTNIDYYSSLTSIWSDSICRVNTELSDSLWKSIDPVSNDSSLFSKLESELFSKDSYDEKYKEAFAIYDLTPDVFGVVIYPGYFTATNNTKLQRDVVESIIEILYRYSAFHDIAKTEYFKAYLKLLSVGQ